MNLKKLFTSKWKVITALITLILLLSYLVINYGVSRTCNPDLDQTLKAWEKSGFSGSIAILKDDKFECLGGYGLANQQENVHNTANTVFSIGSVSKSFTAAAIFKLIDSGKLSLDDRAGDLLPELTGPVSSVTIRQLLLHTSGIIGGHGRDHQPLGFDEAIDAISKLDQKFTPGSEFLYSNAGYTLLGLIIERVSGMSYREYMQSQILVLPDKSVIGGFWDGKPAAEGYRAIGYLEDDKIGVLGEFNGPHWAVDGNGDLAMSTPKLARWTYALFNGKLLSRKSTAAISTPGFIHGNGTSEAPGWVVFDPQIYGETGFTSAGGGGDVGHNTIVAWLPKTKRVIAISSNTSRIKAEELLETLASALVTGEPLPKPPTSLVKVEKKELLANEGSYSFKSGSSINVVAKGIGLTISANGIEAINTLFPLPKDVTTDKVRSHEKNVLNLLSGKSQEGKKERKAFELAFGSIEEVKLLGSLVKNGDLRTYVTITSKKGPILLWYSLNSKGGVSAAEVKTKNPTRMFIPIGNHVYQPDDNATDNKPDVKLEFKDGQVIISGPNGAINAKKML